MGFKDNVAADLQGVFLRTYEFAERKDIIYDGEVYRDVPVVLSSTKEQSRNVNTSDHFQKVYRTETVLHCDPRDMDGVIPEQGMRFEIADPMSPGAFRRLFYVRKSGVEMGMLRLELEGLDE